MNQPSEPVTVTILDRQYQFACDPDQRKALIEAAQQLDDSMREIKDTGRLMSLERIALQAALNFSAQLLTLQHHADLREEKIDSKIRMLADQLDGALNESSD
jgi:cell division protein ZapA